MSLCCKIREADKIRVKRQPCGKTSVIQRSCMSTRLDGAKRSSLLSSSTGHERRPTRRDKASKRKNKNIIRSISVSVNSTWQRLNDRRWERLYWSRLTKVIKVISPTMLRLWNRGFKPGGAGSTSNREWWGSVDSSPQWFWKWNKVNIWVSAVSAYLCNRALGEGAA